MQRIFLFAILASLIFASCGRMGTNKDSTTTQDVAMVEVGFNEIQKITEDALKENEPGNVFEVLYGSGVVVSVDPPFPDMTFPKVLTIDFGDGVADLLGNIRTGSIEIQATGLYRDEGAVLTTTPNNYTLNGYLIEGVKTVTNNGINAEGNTNFDISIVDGKVTDPDGEFATWNSERNKEWIVGESTTFLSDGIPGILDDAYSLTGSASGVNRNGLNFTMDIIDPLIVSLDCKWIKQGVLEINPDGVDTRSLDYGDGECDNQATISVGDWSYTFNMW
ncbi:MAG: hypothetical protein CMB32_00960 [Euryarchaeota archaeon]|nr:hypothetical protein [Euryarchaeota archaeon]